MNKNFKCPECGQLVSDGFTELTFTLEGINVTVKNVPAKICPHCGQEFIDGYVAENVNRLVDRVVEDVNSFSKKVSKVPFPTREIVIAA